MAMHRFLPVDLDKKLEVGRDEASIDRLSAAMIFPSNPDDQIEYFRDLALPRYSTYSKTAVSPKYSTFTKRIVDGVNNGIVAGSCLMYFRFLHKADIATKAGNSLVASQRVVFHLCKEYNLGRARKSEGGNSDGYPTVTIPKSRKIWKDYQRVSHLWAAYIHICLDGKPTFVGPKDYVLEDVDVSVLLFLARQYERFFKEFFDGGKCGNFTREEILPFKARYHDWSRDDVLEMDIPLLGHICDWAAIASENYAPDE